MRMRDMRIGMPGTLVVLLGIVAGCTTGADEIAGAGDVAEEGDKIFITDRSGKSWEVSHAKEAYGLQPELFQFGLGPDAIRPINNARFHEPGDAGYPGSEETFLVLATRISDDARAYRITTMSRNEVANEVFGDNHVAPAY